MLLLTDDAGPVSIRFWYVPEIAYPPTPVQLVELLQATPMSKLLSVPWLGLATIAQVLPFQLSTRVWGTLDALRKNPTATQLLVLGHAIPPR
jgi:hypothetical protein